DPDLLPLVLPSALVDAERAALPELPGQRRARYRDALGLGRYDAEVLTADEDTSRYFDAVLATGADPKTAANWVNTELKGRLDGRPLTEAPVTAEALGQLLAALASGRISGKLAKDAFARMCAGDSVAVALAAVGEQVSDVPSIDAAITAALDATPGEVAAFHGGKTKVVGFFVGQVMKAMKGRANPELVNSRLLVLLEARRQPQ
ncbi:MAG: Asp-tRNA(Asn)/Glu-tRNA(Gln) amidotransferase GatCAB subunit B, partial [Myxococcales bacterium]|nr:Asp-tRNA(Asn)/Glu-tRNA(Gln) amidotransferase GatCAB subunit B [Myxococcales bacterium]